MYQSSDDIANKLKQLLPPSPLWEDPSWQPLLLACADEPSLFLSTLDVLIREANPLSTSLLLAARETEAGLSAAGLTVAERMTNLAAQWSAQGGQSRAYYIAVAAAMGWTITISEYRPFRIGQSPIGNYPLWNDNCCFTWVINASGSAIQNFQIGSSRIGDPLRTWGNSSLENVFEKLKPAHTTVVFAYS